MIRLIIVLLVSLVINTNIFGQPLSFYKENITMKIEKEHFYVNGIYYLDNINNDIRSIIYPLPVDSVYGPIDSLYIINLTSGKIIQPIKEDSNLVVFKVDFSKHNKIEIQISYRQKLFGNRAEYILNSTLAWKKPIGQVNYQLIVPAEIEIQDFSIQPDDLIINTNSTVYYWEKYNYLPSENLIFDFTEKE